MRTKVIRNNDLISPLSTLDNLIANKKPDSVAKPATDYGVPEQSENIQVAIRVRPINNSERESEESVSVLDESTIILKKGHQRLQMFFDRVFPPESTQREVYDMVKDTIDAVTQGYNGTVFAYGQTGTGKTHTMLGFDLKDERRGIIPRSVSHILDFISLHQDTTKFKITCSYLEIYNEKIFDLLVTGKNLKTQNLEIREDRMRGVYVQDLTFCPVTRKEDIFQLMERGALNRSMAATNMNERSSRSHTIFQMYIEQEDKKKHSDSVVKVSKLNLVDLAGSEKWDTFGGKISDKRIQELTCINQSLSTLGLCISALMQSGRSHIPFRDSKLTRLLQDSLGGNTKTVFVATVSPSVVAFEETHSTLKFADRAKRVVLTTRVNEVVEDSVLVKRMEKEIARLRGLLKAKNGNEDELKRVKDENTLLRKENEQLHKLLNNKGVNLECTSAVKQADFSRRIELLRGIEDDQREREEELGKYHSWLHSIPVKYDGEEYSLDIKDRLKLMEQSVSMQAGELIRAKKMFVRDLKIVKDELSEKVIQVETLEKDLQALKQENARLVELSKLKERAAVKEQSVQKEVCQHEVPQEIVEQYVCKFDKEAAKLDRNMNQGLEAFRSNLIGIMEEEVSDPILQDTLNQIVFGCSEALAETVLSGAQQFVKEATSMMRKVASVSSSGKQQSCDKSEKSMIQEIKYCLEMATKDYYQEPRASIRTHDYWTNLVQEADGLRSEHSRIYRYGWTMRCAIQRVLQVVEKFQKSDANQLEYHRQYLSDLFKDLSNELRLQEEDFYPETIVEDDHSEAELEDSELSPQKDLSPKKLTPCDLSSILSDESSSSSSDNDIRSYSSDSAY